LKYINRNKGEDQDQIHIILRLQLRFQLWFLWFLHFLLRVNNGL